ncbi:MAG: preprotein translocase subunit SecY [Candidatus Doudnabacteria bacterium Gr01-1014_77]|uniref:Protein translocase subunit SecY n=1 Tax=Candidatus Doudnabacteria bacterium Gr01-1014_77 TaxID=2017133 RepID=A0A554J9E7_9BACT|nr:MAG: preprotein translocase subunit SecY [Candidatus Doudnabacteria bacterium Gr01-1014_77]
MNKIALIWKTKDLRNKILIMVGLLILTRFLAHIPIPGLSATSLQNFFNQNQLFNLLDIFSGGGLSNLSIAMLGVGPYITASIVIQLLTVIIPSFSELQKEGGEAGRAKLAQYTRYLTVPLAVLQGYSTIRLFQSAQGGAAIGNLTSFQWLITLVAVAVGTILLMWLGELITEYGIGNGISLIIFAGIVARLPQSLQQMASLYDPSKLPMIIAFIAAGLLVIAAVVYVTEAQRNIPVSYAKRMTGNKTYGGVSTHLPLRVNQAGVIPIIFAISVMLLPGLIANFFLTAKSAMVANAANYIVEIFRNQTFYAILYFVLVLLFTFLYTAIVFNPDEISENIQKNGGFVPGLRPGRQTAEYLYRVLNRITVFGAVFLALIAVLPYIFQAYTNTQVLTLGGTSLLIVVSVVIETIKSIEAQMVMRDYETI